MSIGLNVAVLVSQTMLSVSLDFLLLNIGLAHPHNNLSVSPVIIVVTFTVTWAGYK